MSAVEPSTSAPKWYENKTVLTVSTITGLVLGMLSLGVVIAAMGTSPTWFYAGHDDPQFSPDLPHGSEIEQTCQYGAQVGAVALAPCIGGFVLFIISSVALYRKHKESLSKDLKTILAGVVVAAFAAGLIIGSSTILQGGVSRMEDLIAQGRHDSPDATVRDGYDYHWEPQWYKLWDRLQVRWLDPTKSNMNGILTAGVFGALGGAGIFATAIFGISALSCYSKYKSKEKKDDNTSS